MWSQLAQVNLEGYIGGNVIICPGFKLLEPQTWAFWESHRFSCLYSETAGRCCNPEDFWLSCDQFMPPAGHTTLEIWLLLILWRETMHGWKAGTLLHESIYFIFHKRVHCGRWLSNCRDDSNRMLSCIWQVMMFCSPSMHQMLSLDLV